MKGTPIYNIYQEAYWAHRNIRPLHEEAGLKEVKARYKTEQPVIDIQRQPRGLPIVEQDRMKAEDYAFLERVRSLKPLHLCHFISRRGMQTADSSHWRRDCPSQESRGVRRRKRSKSDTKPEKEDTPSTLSESFLLQCKPTQCIFCLGDKE